MIYRQFQDKQLSGLGLGMMRLPVIEGDGSRIDHETAQRMVDQAMAAGVNYYDTAWVYHHGNSEVFAGKALAKYPRDSYYLATKFPGFQEELIGKVEEIFEKQLERCQVDYFDFYLLHCIDDRDIDGYLDPANRIRDYLTAQKAAGRIHHLGFSAHASLETLKRFLEAYHDVMEFGQLQLNYLDWTYQDAKAAVELLDSYGIPVWVMEPVRGGRLAQVEPEYEAKLRALRPEENVPGWAFRFLQTVPQVTMVLSGMSNEQQLKQNLATWAEDKPLNEEEWAALQEIAEGMKRSMVLPCTNCRYCVSQCPQEIHIPDLLNLYGKCVEKGTTKPAQEKRQEAGMDPAACIGCQSCEQVCPQSIGIADVMAKFAAWIER